jgi:uncharacterized membrane protein
MEKILLNNCSNFIKSEKFKNELKEFTKPLFEYFLNEIGIYLYFFIFFILTSFILHLGIFIILIKYILKDNNHNK